MNKLTQVLLLFLSVTCSRTKETLSRDIATIQLHRPSKSVVELSSQTDSLTYILLETKSDLLTGQMPYLQLSDGETSVHPSNGQVTHPIIVQIHLK